MKGRGKSYRAALAKVDRGHKYTLVEGVGLLKETAHAKFDETVELAVRLGVDPRQADQN
ncbi:MAG: 50S ribosomal protein L1, partial [Candidatus Binatia bacterium]